MYQSEIHQLTFSEMMKKVKEYAATISECIAENWPLSFDWKIQYYTDLVGIQIVLSENKGIAHDYANELQMIENCLEDLERVETL